ncbi:hypothetical protein D3C87_1186350 [compost metagenome]
MTGLLGVLERLSSQRERLLGGAQGHQELGAVDVERHLQIAVAGVEGDLQAFVDAGQRLTETAQVHGGHAFHGERHAFGHPASQLAGSRKGLLRDRLGIPELAELQGGRRQVQLAEDQFVALVDQGVEPPSLLEGLVGFRVAPEREVGVAQHHVGLVEAQEVVEAFLDGQGFLEEGQALLGLPLAARREEEAEEGEALAEGEHLAVLTREAGRLFEERSGLGGLAGEVVNSPQGHERADPGLVVAGGLGDLHGSRQGRLGFFVLALALQGLAEADQDVGKLRGLAQGFGHGDGFLVGGRGGRGVAEHALGVTQCRQEVEAQRRRLGRR